MCTVTTVVIYVIYVRNHKIPIGTRVCHIVTQVG